MKKIFKHLTVFSVLFVMLFIITGCSKKAITAEQFKEKMENKGYKIYDVTSQYESQISIKKGYVASKDNKYQIEFYELNNKSAATYMYKNNKEIFEDNKGSDSIVTDVNLPSYSKYNSTTNGKYRVLCQVKNTFLYVEVSKKYKEDVKDIEDYLGY